MAHVTRLLALTLLLAACSQRTPEQKLLTDIDPARSWVATLQLAGEKWLANSVPKSFVRAAIGAAQKTFEQAARAIDRSSAQEELRHRLRAQLETANAAAAQLKEAIERGDRRSAAVSVARFAAVQATLQKAGR